MSASPPTEKPILLDGPVGTELLRRGVPTPLPFWSAYALEHHPDVVAAIHRDYSAAGATVHTTNTFRTKRRTYPSSWETLARRAVKLARGAVPDHHRVAGSLSPLEDCYRPESSPSCPRSEHRELARVLVDEGVDLLLCETFPHRGEALIAVEEAVATGVETWLSLTPGPRADLLTPKEVARGAVQAIDAGARGILVNCLPLERASDYLLAVRDVISATPSPVRFGVYPNSGSPDDRMGWTSEDLEVSRFAEAMTGFLEDGATIFGGCCGTGPGHLRELARRIDFS